MKNAAKRAKMGLSNRVVVELSPDIVTPDRMEVYRLTCVFGIVSCGFEAVVHTLSTPSFAGLWITIRTTGEAFTGAVDNSGKCLITG